MSAKDRYKLLIGSVVPRPIAWITTVDPQGRVNAAPFSFFNVLSSDPAIVGIGIENHADGSPKDTGRNIRDIGEFTVNIAGTANLEAMNVTAVAFGPEVDELQAAGLTALPGHRVKSPFIAQAPVALECLRHITLEISPTRAIVLGRVVAMHLRSDIVNERLHVDPVALDALGRMGGAGYCRTGDVFDLPTPSLAEWQGRG
ncbi:flavin reductase family protein [Phaeovulum sp. W22_SRMD_FR3]